MNENLNDKMIIIHERIGDHPAAKWTIPGKSPDSVRSSLLRRLLVKLLKDKSKLGKAMDEASKENRLEALLDCVIHREAIDLVRATKARNKFHQSWPSTPDGSSIDLPSPEPDPLSAVELSEELAYLRHQLDLDATDWQLLNEILKNHATYEEAGNRVSPRMSKQAVSTRIARIRGRISRQAR